MKAITLLLLIMIAQQPSFRETQKQHARVKAAYEEKEVLVKSWFGEKKIPYTTYNLFLRAFKKEKKLEVWVQGKVNEAWQLLHTYDFCTSSGFLGPKRREGDLQIPEGVYQINHFNPQSNFHLSLGIDYPNASDRILSDKKHPGGEIYIHGNCVTIGCIPITDDKIKELYVLAVEARHHGQTSIPVHIFPSRLSADQMTTLASEYADHTELVTFWKNLQPIYLDFESTRQLKKVTVGKDGQYALAGG
jgi:murein L,D-transpeptidase YafK